MKKKVGLILLSLTMCMGSIAPVYAAANQNTSTVIKHVDPRYKDIQMIITSFEVLPSGRAEYGAQIFTTSGYKIRVRGEIEEWRNGEWVSIYSDTRSEKVRDMSYNGYTVVDPDGDYRMKYTITVSYGSGSVETVTEYHYAN